jgi:hypothetical protein
MRVKCRAAKQDRGVTDQTMSLSMRFFLVEPSGEIVRIPYARFQRLFTRNSKDKLPEYPNQRIQTADAIVELENRRPVRVVRLYYGHYNFDGRGVLDYDQAMKEGMTHVEANSDLFSGYFEPDQGKNVVNAKRRFAKRRLQEVVKWKPTQEQERMICEIALGVRKCRTI